MSTCGLRDIRRGWDNGRPAGQYSTGVIRRRGLQFSPHQDPRFRRRLCCEWVVQSPDAGACEAKPPDEPGYRYTFRWLRSVISENKDLQPQNQLQMTTSFRIVFCVASDLREVYRRLAAARANTAMLEIDGSRSLGFATMRRRNQTETCYTSSCPLGLLESF